MDTRSAKNVVFGFAGARVGTTNPATGEPFYQSAELCQLMSVARYELFFQSQYRDVAEEQASLITNASPPTKVQLNQVTLKDPWDLEEVYVGLDQFAAAYPFDETKERYFVHPGRGTFIMQICLYLLVEARHIPATLVNNAPRDDTNPNGKIAEIDLQLSKYQKIAARFRTQSADATTTLKGGIATANTRFNDVVQEIVDRAVDTTEPVLLLGPTGCGKSELAKRIHELRQKRRLIPANSKLIAVNCATIRGEMGQSTLFGHVKGAFTGAYRDRTGLIKMADNGVLFLDEIADLPLSDQPRLLRVLDEKEFYPDGSDKIERSDFQLIAASNRDLRAAVRKGEFREDLLARLETFCFRLPGLRDRPQDIEPNLDFELGQLKRPATMTPEAREAFLTFAIGPQAAWTANFRDLHGAVVRMSSLAVAGTITKPIVQREILELKERWRQAQDGQDDRCLLLNILTEEQLERIDAIDQVQLAHVIRICRKSSSRADAGRQLYTGTRTAPINYSSYLNKYLERFGTDFPACKFSPGAD